jgi:ABC-type transporter Mla MlaB component
MTIEFKDGALVCAGTLAVDDAEALLQLLLKRPADAPPAQADLADCAHVHSACLQVLMAAPVRVARWPADAGLAAWLQAALKDNLQT